MKNSKKPVVHYRERALNRPINPQNGDPARKTDQSFKDDCNVNFIVSRFMKTGQISHLAKRQGHYSDMSYAPSDLLEAYKVVKDAEEAFASLPAAVRKRFENNPSEILQFLEDPKNRDEAIELGLIPETKLDPLVPKESSDSKKPKEPMVPKSKAPAKNDDSNDE